MLTNKNVCACIITFNPDIDRLIENVKSISTQVGAIILVDNGSQNYDEFIDKLVGLHIDFFYQKRFDENMGIALALNDGCSFAQEQGYQWVLTLDQDSVCDPKLIEVYLNFINSNDTDTVGQLCCLIKDRNVSSDTNADLMDSTDVDWCITSGSLVNIACWKSIDGFDDRLFIDGVDRDFGLCLKEHGFRTVRINFLGLLHEVGKISRIVSLFGKKHPVYNHSPFRKYYISRNAIIIARKHDSINLRSEIKRVRKRIFFEFILYRL